MKPEGICHTLPVFLESIIVHFYHFYWLLSLHFVGLGVASSFPGTSTILNVS
jgi:hypothetical protein